jgi:integrase
MNLEQHAGRDDMKVWLSTSGDPSEVDQLLEATGDTNQRIAFGLGVYCGLRSEEIVAVRPEDVVDTDAGPMVRVHDGKGGKYRETPCPGDLANTIRTAADYREEPKHYPIVTSQSSATKGATTRTLRRWMEHAREEVAAETGDEMWLHLTFHDLRRTWADGLRAAGADPLLVCDWGGWEDLETFLEHYKGVNSPEAQRRERAKVDWLS